ncbi:flagellar biosynthesis anti-sigma factor FlgM [Endozoicomonadaceae bacterium StTr2]
MDSSRISGSPQPGIFSTGKKTTRKQHSKTGVEGDAVNLSEDMQSLQQASAAAHNAPEIDEAKVAEIRSAIARGELQINAERLAQKMLDLEESLFGK